MRRSDDDRVVSHDFIVTDECVTMERSDDYRVMSHYFIVIAE